MWKLSSGVSFFITKKGTNWEKHSGNKQMRTRVEYIIKYLRAVKGVTLYLYNAS